MYLKGALFCPLTDIEKSASNLRVDCIWDAAPQKGMNQKKIHHHPLSLASSSPQQYINTLVIIGEYLAIIPLLLLH